MRKREDCKLPVSLAYAETAQNNRNRDYALAGYWLEMLAMVEQGRLEEAEAVLPELVQIDNNLNSTQSARVLLNEAIVELGDIREEYGLSRSCS
jgi:hypothetical protein